MPNRLINESSLYLQQHANNPVDWYPFGEEAFREAKLSNRPVLISIGYSSCHWCHVMEKESFCNPEIASIMNSSFICIKVDREERPDIDMVYMEAVNLLHGNGGWPLNCFGLPDGRPFWGGTYFRPDQWQDLLIQIDQLFKQNDIELISQAERLHNGIVMNNIVKMPADPKTITSELITVAYENLSLNFDSVNGGFLGSPKFPMPVIWQFVSAYHWFSRNQEALEQVRTTLDNILCGGIFDQLGGGFARYSTDGKWRIPHFEKMLYDNAQLVSLYAEFYKLTGKKTYSEAVTKTIEFIFSELLTSEGLFCSSIDADSEGSEGLFYLWTRQQVKEILPEYGDLLADYWGIDKAGLWENGMSVLLRPADDSVFAAQQHLSEVELRQLLFMAGKQLLTERNKRIRPALDNKVIVSWNAMMIKALTDAFKTYGNKEWLEAAINAGKRINEEFSDANGRLQRVRKNGNSSVDAFLDDYAFVAEAYLALYQVTFDESWLFKSDILVRNVINHFSDQSGSMFWYQSDYVESAKTSPAFARPMQTTDGVMPSGNTIFAGVLLSLGLYMDNRDYQQHAIRMVANLQNNIKDYPSAYSGWAKLGLVISQGIKLLIITGPDAYRNASLLNRKYNPGILISAAREKSALKIYKDKFITEKNLIYKCHNGTCSLPVSSIVDLIV